MRILFQRFAVMGLRLTPSFLSFIQFCFLKADQTGWRILIVGDLDFFAFFCYWAPGRLAYLIASKPRSRSPIPSFMILRKSLQSGMNSKLGVHTANIRNWLTNSSSSILSFLRSQRFTVEALRLAISSRDIPSIQRYLSALSLYSASSFCSSSRSNSESVSLSLSLVVVLTTYFFPLALLSSFLPAALP